MSTLYVCEHFHFITTIHLTFAPIHSLTHSAISFSLESFNLRWWMVAFHFYSPVTIKYIPDIKTDTHIHTKMTHISECKTKLAVVLHCTHRYRWYVSSLFSSLYFVVFVLLSQISMDAHAFNVRFVCSIPFCFSFIRSYRPPLTFSPRFTLEHYFLEKRDDFWI